MNGLLRVLVGLAGVVFMGLGVYIILHQPPSRGRSLVLVLGIVGVTWAVFGRLPGGRRR
jgi:drug/metabolite transporter (DMT)-like permease